MTDENYQRKLTAILSADVVGFSRLMREDEVSTVSTLKTHRNLISEKVQFGFEFMGDQSVKNIGQHYCDGPLQR